MAVGVGYQDGVNVIGDEEGEVGVSIIVYQFVLVLVCQCCDAPHPTFLNVSCF